jgi:hypothetical protein
MAVGVILYIFMEKIKHLNNIFCFHARHSISFQPSYFFAYAAGNKFLRSVPNCINNYTV